MQKIKKWIHKNWQLVVFLFSLLIVISLLKDVLGKEIIKCDTIAYNVIVAYLRNDILTSIMKLITFLGSAPFLIIVALLSLFLFKNKKKGIAVAINLALVPILNNIFKFFVQRPRPDGYQLVIEKGFSFPSGHSMVSMAFYGFFIYLIYQNIENKKWKWILITFLSFLILAIGFSRIYLGVHYASDVLAGYFTSILYLILFIKVIAPYIKKGEVHEK